MSTVPDRKTLEGLKRVELQKLCKEHGLRANLKSESLVDLLIEATKPASSSQLPRPTRASSMRIISKSSSGSRPRDLSASSVIIHDTDEEAEPEDASAVAGPSCQSDPAPTPTPPVQVAGRAPRKAKDSQYKLGVGRPTLAGGSGARAVTRAGSISKPKRGKAPSTSIKPNEEAIQEVEEETDTVLATLSEVQAGPSGTSHEDPLAELRRTVPPLISPALPDPGATLVLYNMETFRATIEEMILPIRDQMQTLNTNFDEVARNAAEASSLRSQITSLTQEVATLRIQAERNVRLEAEINMLKEHIAAIRESSALDTSRVRTESNDTTDKSSALDFQQVIPSSSSGLLGKRQRSPNEDNLGGILESGQDSVDDPSRALQPSKKRAKLSEEDEISGLSRTGGSQPRTPGGDVDMPVGSFSSVSEQGFTVYNGPEILEEDPPPPTNHLSDLFTMPGPSSNAAAGLSNEGDRSITQSTAFTFTFPGSGFHPSTSTPIANFGVGPIINPTSIPFPEPPTSPTPSPERVGRRPHPFVSPVRSPVRPRSAAGRLPSLPPAAALESILPVPISDELPQFISPVALMRSPSPLTVATPETSRGNGSKQTSLGIGIGRPRSSGIGMGPGAVALPLPMPPDTPAPPMKRTMYGTELEADSRFGDFGQDGIAMGFWTGVTPRF